jgi:hypothetical protein
VISKDVDGGPPLAMTITTNRRVNDFGAWYDLLAAGRAALKWPAAPAALNQGRQRTSAITGCGVGVLLSPTEPTDPAPLGKRGGGRVAQMSA